MKVADVIVLLEACGSGQWGLVTTQQAVATGVPRIWMSRLNQRGIIRKIRQGVYELPSAVRDNKLGLYATWLATEPAERAVHRRRENNPVVVSHESAAQIHRLGKTGDGRFHFTSAERKQTGTDDIVYYKAALPTSDIEYIDGLPVTTIERTIADLAATMTDEQALAEVLRDGVASRKVNILTLQARLYHAALNQGFANGREYFEYLEKLAPHPKPAEALSEILPNLGAIDLSELTNKQGSELAKLLGLDELVKQAVAEQLQKDKKAK